jgi:RNA polymerase sigma factor (sigma-70 family)
METRVNGRVHGEDDRARFARVVLPHLDDAYALARWLTGNRADAEDVAQEAFLRAFAGIGGFKDGNARAWVMTIVRNTAYAWLGRNRSAALVITDDLEAVERDKTERGDQSGAEIETPEAALIAKADVAQLRSAIAALPTEFRETLVLRELQGFGYREIASMTGVPIGTVMSRLARARRRLLLTLTEDRDVDDGARSDAAAIGLHVVDREDDNPGAVGRQGVRSSH